MTSRVELLRMITINYAKLTGEADIKGSIEPGKLADFVVLSDDILSVAERSIPNMKALATYVGGKESLSRSVVSVSVSECCVALSVAPMRASLLSPG